MWPKFLPFFGGAYKKQNSVGGSCDFAQDDSITVPVTVILRGAAKRSRRIHRALFSLLCALGLAALANAQSFTIRDDSGNVEHFAKPAARVVSLMPSMTESVWIMGAGNRLVGIDRYSNWPEAIAHLPRLGGLYDPYLEAIAALKPDVVLASASNRSVERLRAVGIHVVRMKSNTHEDIHRTLLMLEQLLGLPHKGEAVWQNIQLELSQVALDIPQNVRGQRIYFDLGEGAYAAGGASFIGQTLTKIGMRNVVPDDLGPFPKLNPEFIVRADPDGIVGLERDIKTMPQRPGWRALKALRENHTCALTSKQYDILVRPGPRLAQAARVLADCFRAWTK